MGPMWPHFFYLHYFTDSSPPVPSFLLALAALYAFWAFHHFIYTASLIIQQQLHHIGGTAAKDD